MALTAQALPDWKPARFPTKDSLIGHQIQLDALTPDHAAGLFDAFAGDKALFDYLPVGPFDTFEEFESWVRMESEDETDQFYAIIDKQSARPIGIAAYLRIDIKNGSIEVGCLCFSSALQRTPKATEAMYLMMRNAFEMGYRRYEWKCNDLNKPSIKAAQRLGFSYEGTFRQAAVVKGHNRDTTWFSIIDSEWPAIKSSLEAWLSDDNFNEQGQQRKALSEMTKPLVTNWYAR